MFGALSVFGRRIKGVIHLGPEQVWTCNVTRNHYLLLSASFHSWCFCLGRVVRICGVVPFLERLCHCETEWTQENVIKFIELYKWYFNKIRNKVHGRNWEKKWTELSMSAQRKRRTTYITVGPVGIPSVGTAAYRLIYHSTLESHLSPPGALRAHMSREASGRERENCGRETADWI
jgi:hypothetical protein